MILVCGIPSEPPVAMVHEALLSIGAPVVVFNQRSFAQSHFDFQISRGHISGTFQLAGQAYNLEEINGVYMRLIDEEALPEVQSLPPNDGARRRCHDLHQAVLCWLEITPARVVNRCRPMASNCSKPYQAQLIAAQGFSVPETLITNDPEQVRAFHAEHGRIIYKSISGVRSIVQDLTEADEARLENIRWCPTQFQSFVEGTNVRVHVVGEQVFATEIATDVTDYRYATRQGGDTQLTAVELDDDLSQRCVNLAAALNLPFAGIDLKVTPSDEVFCFEVNPSPGYTYYENNTGQPIAAAVARYLAAAS